MKTVKMIDVDDWDDLVKETYNKMYSFQQQDDCKERQIVNITVPTKPMDYENDTIPEIINGDVMGVSFDAWLARDINQNLEHQDDSYLELFWERNFYPHVSMIVNDLYKKGLLEAGEFSIDIDW